MNARASTVESIHRRRLNAVDEDEDEDEDTQSGIEGISKGRSDNNARHMRLGQGCLVFVFASGR